MTPVYMDHHATTPLLPEVLDAMLPFFREAFANPASTTHPLGRRAADAVEQARAQAAALLGAPPGELVFTSGATEANNLALRGVCAAAQESGRRPHLITSTIEHKSVLDTAADLEASGIPVTVLPVDEGGRLDPEALRKAIRPETCLVSVQLANSEVGTVQPLQEIGAVCASRRVPLHSDVVQAVGRIPLDLQGCGVALASLSAHKFHGPKGIGALLVSRRVRIRAQLTGGGQERGRRSGTLNVPGIIGMAVALERAVAQQPTEAERLRELRDLLWVRLRERIPEIRRNGHPVHGLPNNLNVSFRDVEGEALLMAVKGFALSSGSACTSGSAQGSYVIRALGAAEEDAHSSIRFGLGRGNTRDHVEALAEELAGAVARLRAISVPRTDGAAKAG